MIARTEAAGSAGLLPEVLAFTSSLAADRALVREDLLGSLAHLTMLGRCGIVPLADARKIREGLLALLDLEDRGQVALRDEEDVHMAVEAELTRRLGEVAGRLHSARSRNDQVALDLRLHVREGCRRALLATGQLLAALADRAEAERETLIPAYTHRQRAQAVSVSYYLCGYGMMFARDVEALGFAADQSDALPLGIGAIAGTSLPIDRQLTRELLSFGRLTENGLDAVGDRDFALDFAYAAARCQLHASRVATDIIDFASAEFGYVRLLGTIALGSSLMPQKRNPDLFELVRGKTAPAIGDLLSLFTLLKGLPGGYNRDLQEDRGAILAVGPRLVSVLQALKLGLSQIQFDKARALAAVEGDHMQAADLAEALVKQGLPFRTAYQIVGRVVSLCQAQGLPLGGATPALVAGAHPELTPALTAALLGALSPVEAVARKVSAGSTGPVSVEQQIFSLRRHVAACEARAAAIPSLDAIGLKLREVTL